MGKRLKRVFASFMAAVIICTMVELPIELEAAEVPSPALPSFISASDVMGAITSIELVEKELKLHTTASNQAVTLSIAFLKDGGIRLYDNEENNGIFELDITSIAAVDVLSHENKVITAQGSEGGTKIILDYSQDVWELSIRNSEDDMEIYSITAEDMATSYDSENQRQYVSLRGDIASDEQFIGLGERYSGLILNGQSYELWNKDCWSKGTDSYVNIPLLHSNKGYSLFFNSYYGAVADIGATDAGTYALNFSGPDLDFYIWTGTPLENLKSYTKLTGTSASIPKWAVGYTAGGTTTGYWDSMDTTDEEGKNVDNSKAVLQNMLQKYEDIGTLPSAVFGESGPTRIPEAYELCNEKDVKLLGWWHPDIPWVTWDNQKYDYSFLKNLMKATNDSELPAIYKKDNANQFFVETDSYGNEWLKIDYTHENADVLVKNNLNTWWSYGLSGLMVDYGEYIEPNMKFANGLYGDEMHNLQAYSYTKTVKEAWDDSEQKGDYLLFARAGAAGSQQYAALFAGDQKATFEGLQQAIQGGISAGTTGFSVWGSDVGGLQGMPTEELYLRWLGFSTFSPLMRSHGSEGCDPWNYDSTEGDTSAQEAFQKYYWLRENLTDAIYSASIQANKDGTPIMQAMALAFPNENDLFSVEDQYLFCDEILVCPVYTEGATEREVLLPAGTWYNLLSGETIKSDGTKRTVSADVDETPAFIQSGTVMPIDISSKTWTLTNSMGEDNVRTKALLVTSAQKEGTKSIEWWQNETEKSVFSYTTNKNGHTILASQSENAKVMIAYGMSPTQIVVDGEPLCKLYKKPTGEQSGFYVDETANQTIVVLPDETWEEVQIITEEIWDYEFELKKGYEDVSYLDKAFEVYHYPFAYDQSVATVEKVVGPALPSDEAPNSNPTVDYFTTKYYGTHSHGYLKPGDTSGGMATLTYKNSTFENFEAEYEMYTTWSIFGLAFGGREGVLPVSRDDNIKNDTGVLICMETGGGVHIGGTIDTGTAVGTSVSVTPYSKYTKFNGTANLLTGSMTGKDIQPVKNPDENSETYTVCVRVENGMLTVWEKSNPEKNVKVKLSLYYQGGYVSLIANQTQDGAFKAFRIRTLDNEVNHKVDFEQLSKVNDLDEAFTAYHFATTDSYENSWDVNGSPYDTLGNEFDSYYFESATANAVKGEPTAQWFTNPANAPGDYDTRYDNWCLKPMHKNSGGQCTLLTLREPKVKNFTAKVTYETNWTNYGLMVAPAGKLSNAKNGFKVDVDSNGKIRVEGTIDTSDVSWSGAGTAEVKNKHLVWGPALEGYSGPVANASPSIRYTLIVTVQDDILTVGVEGFEGVLTVKLSEDYKGGHVSLWSTGYDQGGFDQFDITAESVSVSGRPSKYWNRNLKEDVQIGTDKAYLKPNHLNSSRKVFTFLTYNREEVCDFKTQVEIANNWTEYGVSVAPAGEMFQADNGIAVYIDSDGGIHINGAIDVSTAVVEGSDLKTAENHVRTSGISGFIAPSGTNSEGTVYTLCVTHEAGILSAYILEYPAVKISVATTKSYQGGSLSIYSTGRNQGGFKSWEFDTYVSDTVILEKGRSEGDVIFTVRTDLAYHNIAATVNYDMNAFTYKNAVAMDGVTVDVRKKSDGTLQLYLSSSEGEYYLGKWVTLIFEANVPESKLSLAVRTSNAEGDARNVRTFQVFPGDVNNDCDFTVQDLVRLKRYIADETVSIHMENSQLNSSVDITSAENLIMLRKRLVEN